MKQWKITRRPLNKSALACVWGENEIKRIVKDAFFLRLPEAETRKKAAAVIKKTVDDITIQKLKEDAFVSLWSFYRQQIVLWRQIPPVVLLTFLALGRKAGTMEYAKDMTLSQADDILLRGGFLDTNRDFSKQYGVPLREYVDKYFSERIEPVMETVTRTRATDPEAPTRLSLRAKAELAVRYEHNQSMVDDLRESGTRLVVSSSHADCSDRCRPWQNKVFSLDGTSGKTDDGRSFQPLENATNILTKNGKWYNGLLGFNCRHYLVPYQKGLQFGSYSEKVEKKEYEITLKQRAMEREIYRYREEAMIQRGIDKEKYRKARDIARDLEGQYRAFSGKNGRAIYLSRTTL